MDTIIIEEMDKLNIWLRWALGVFGAGLMISLALTAIMKAAIAGWIVLPPAMWWGAMVGIALSWLCPVTGIVLAVRGLMMLVKE